MRGAVHPHRSDRGFTLLELLMAMSIFMFLSMLAVYLMRQGLDIFVTGTRESSLQDRTETVLPRLVEDLELLALPASFDPPPPAPTEEERMAGATYVPPPPVDVRLRATTLRLRDVPEGPLKDLPCTYVAWVTDVSGDLSDPLLRRAGLDWGPGRKDLTPTEVDRANPNTRYKPTGGLREVCYVAVPEDPEYPALLTLYYGWRSPVGGEASLLEPENLDTLREVREVCRPIARGLLYLGMTWRRVFAGDWEPTLGRVGERDPYVGSVWDSTRALDPKFPLYRDRESLGDPSDDVFPAWARFTVTLVAPAALGLGRGDTALAAGVGEDEPAILVENARALVGPGSDERWLKVDGEWMRYRPSRVDLAGGKVLVERGGRKTTKRAHDGGAEVYVGLTTRSIVRLLYRDHFARAEGRQP